MDIKPHELQGVFVIKFNRIVDSRGFFMRFYDNEIFAKYGLQTCWAQESVSFNKTKNVIRGLHFQLPPLVEAKIVRVVQGAILDIFVDLRKGSNTYGKWGGVELSGENNQAIYIPKGFAHGFRTLTEDTLVEYKIDVPYQSDLASGIRWDDKTLNIDWDAETPLTSQRDAELQFFKDFNSPF